MPSTPNTTTITRLIRSPRLPDTPRKIPSPSKPPSSRCSAHSIDGAIAVGANRINYLNFGLRDDTKARQDAITNASKDAQAQAQALATSLDVKLKRVVKATMIPDRAPIMPMPRMGMAISMGG